MSEIKLTGNIDVSDLIIGGIALVSLLWLVISHVRSNSPRLESSILFGYRFTPGGSIPPEPTHWVIEFVNVNDPSITEEYFIDPEGLRWPHPIAARCLRVLTKAEVKAWEEKSIEAIEEGLGDDGKKEEE